MRRMPLPQTDGGPERPSIGYAQQDIISRAQALWATFQPLYQQLAFAFAVGDDRRLKRLIEPLNALAQDMADCQDILFKAWGIGDFHQIKFEIAAIKNRTPEATARRAADIKSMLEGTEALASKAQEFGLVETASRLRYNAADYGSIADPVMPPLAANTEDKDLDGRDWFIRQSFSTIKLAAENLLAAEEIEAAGARRRRREAENLQNEPDLRNEEPRPPRSDPAGPETYPASGSGSDEKRVTDQQQPSDHRFQQAPLVPGPDTPVDFQTFYRATFQRADQQWTAPPRERSWNEPMVEPPPLMDNRFTSAIPEYLRRPRR